VDERDERKRGRKEGAEREKKVKKNCGKCFVFIILLVLRMSLRYIILSQQRKKFKCREGIIFLRFRELELY
jgi:hypothetical protein